MSKQDSKNSSIEAKTNDIQTDINSSQSEDLSEDSFHSHPKLTWPTRLAYAGGDVACNVVFGMVGTLLTMFYTDYVGIAPWIIGVIMLVSRVFDGFSDLIMGFIVEKTNTRWGKARPWMLWMAVPFAVSAVLLFTVPMGDEMIKAIYIFVTYNLCNTIAYTATNLPYGSLSAMMTRSSKQRDLLSVVRMGLSPVGRIISVTATLPLVTMLGDTQEAWIKVICIWAAIACILLLLCFWRCKETVVIKARKEQAPPVFQAFKALVTNQYFWAVILLWMVQSVSFNISGTMLPYYCEQIFHQKDLYSFLYLTETVILVICVFLSYPLMRKFGKRNIALAGVIIAFFGQILVFFNTESFEAVLASCVIRGIGMAPLNAAVFGMVGDVIEFGHWKNHIRQEGLIFAGGSIGTKVGAGLASAIMTSLLSLAGYVSSTTGSIAQPASAISMIENIYVFGPMLIATLAAIVLILYKLDKKYNSIMHDLEEREEKGEM